MKYAEYAIRIEPSEVFDLAIIGVSKDKVIIYSFYRLIDILEWHGSCSEEEAKDWFDYNIMGLIDNDRPQFRVHYSKRYIWKDGFNSKWIYRPRRSKKRSS